MKYKWYLIELVNWTQEKYYQVFDSLGYYKGERKTIKECKEFINNYLL